MYLLLVTTKIPKQKSSEKYKPIAADGDIKVLTNKMNDIVSAYDILEFSVVNKSDAGKVTYSSPNLEIIVEIIEIKNS